MATATTTTTAPAGHADAGAVVDARVVDGRGRGRELRRPPLRQLQRRARGRRGAARRHRRLRRGPEPGDARRRQGGVDRVAPVAISRARSARFYNGPIDDPDTGPEGLINAWPLDENYIDYVEGAPEQRHHQRPGRLPGDRRGDARGGQRRPAARPTSRPATTRSSSCSGARTQSTTGPGTRPFTDYVTDGSGTAANQERRGQYLQAVGASAGRQPAAGAGRVGARAIPATTAPSSSSIDTDEALGRILTGIGIAERRRARRRAPERRLRDPRSRGRALVLLRQHPRRSRQRRGRHPERLPRPLSATLDGPGIDELVRQVDPALDATLQAQLAASVAAVQRDSAARSIRRSRAPTTARVGSRSRRAITAISSRRATPSSSVAEALGVSTGTGNDRTGVT